MKKLTRSTVPTIKYKISQNTPIEVPWEVWRFMGERFKFVHIGGDQACLGDGDFGTIPELQTAIEWYVDQLGGKVTWEK